MPTAKPAPKPTPTRTPAPPAAPPPKPDRPVVHPQVRAALHLAATGNALTSGDAHAMLGTVEATGEDYLFKGRDGKKYAATKNAHNRIFVQADAETLMQTMLMRDAPNPAARRWWQFNAQPGIIDRYDQVQSFQHRLVALILAEQERTGPNADHWRRYWDGPVTVDTLVVYGTDDAHGVVNTQDTGRPQTYADTLYRGDHFADKPPKERAVLAKALENALKLLWSRVGGEADAFAPQRTHQGMDDFLRRHPRVVEAVKWVVEENGNKGIDAVTGAGTAAGVLYLMAASFSDGAAYHATDGGAPDESRVAFDTPVELNGRTQPAWDRACEFWSLVASKDAPEFKGVRQALGAYHKGAAEDGADDYGLGAVPGAKGSRDEVLAACVGAWGAFVGGGSLTRKALRLTYTLNDDGERVLSDDGKLLRFDGIDRGHPDEEQAGEEGENGFSDAEPDEDTAAAVEAEKERVKAEALAAKKAGKKVSVVTGKPVPSAAGQPLEELPSSKPKRAPAASANGTADKCVAARDGKHTYLPGPGNTPGPACANCKAPNPAAKGTPVPKPVPKAAEKRGGTGK